MAAEAYRIGGDGAGSGPKGGCCGTRRGFLWAVCAYTVLHGMILTGMQPSVVTSIEDRFGYSSLTLGWIIATYDFMFVVLVVPGAFYGAAHRPRALGWGLALLAVGSFLFSLPHFITDEYEPQSGGESLCSALLGDICDVENYDGMLGVFVVAQFVLAAGSVNLWSLGVAHLGDLYDKSELGNALAMFFGSAALGPALGFLISGSIIRRVFVEPGDEGDLNDSDTTWVGAWWLPFLIGAIIALPVSTVFFFFPRDAKDIKPVSSKADAEAPGKSLELTDLGREEAKQMERSPSMNAAEVDTASLLKMSFAELRQQALEIIKIPSWTYNCFAGGIEICVNTGMGTFLAKYLMTQFGVAPGNAAIIMGLTVLAGAMGGLAWGGWYIARNKLDVRGAARFICYLAFASLLIVPPFTLVGCGNEDIVGVTVDFDGSDMDEADLDATCNAGCECGDRQIYRPICGSDDRTYYNPCIAGCEVTEDGGDTYMNCGCGDGGSITAEDGPCFGVCERGQLGVFIIGLFIFMFTTFGSNPAASFVNLRILGEERASVGTAMQAGIIRLFGSVPGPIIMGALLDTVCLQRKEVCDVAGSCEVYDAVGMRRRYLIWGLVGKTLSLALYYLSYRATLREFPDDADAADAAGVKSKAASKAETDS
mmetsp:Transcript_8492/g.24570  ORF Transcript_8492/g.24570 Transcript_8492/m.24570 type:complete len:651 (-) Transcript_8492:319-2271(-)